MPNLRLHDFNGLPVYEAEGPFTAGEVWELIGERSRVATLTFAAGTESYRIYGPSVVGVPLYAPEERLGAPATIDPQTLRLGATMRDVSSDHERELRRQGIPLADVATILFLPIDRPKEHYPSGEKKIPNVIEIPFKADPWVNADGLLQSYLISKSNHGDQLAPFEKAQLVGNLLAFHDGKIDGAIAEHFGYDQERLKSDLEVRWHFLSTKERLGIELTTPEREWLDELDRRRKRDAIAAVVKEFHACHADRVDPAKIGPVLERVLQSAIDFRPDILLHGRQQVYWDLASYTHITMRHVRTLQVIEGTTFPYRAEDLKMLIEKVLGCVADEIREHFERQPGKVFFKAGRRCVYFNDDYYAFHIEPSGRLKNFHRWDSKRRA